MQDTRQQILEILKSCGEVTVHELSRNLKLTSVTVRHHLEILRSEGYISDPEVRRSNRPGRPRYVYRLTSTAADLFPNNYSGLAEALLSAVSEYTTPEERQAILEDAARRIVGDMPPLPAAPEQRMDRLVDFMTRRGFVVRWQQDEAGKYVLLISSCPYHYVAQKQTDTCAIDVLMIGEVSGGVPQRVQGYAREGALCVYEIQWDDV